MKSLNTKPSFNPLLLLLQVAIFMSTFTTSSLAHIFYVGGKEGWVQNPCESFNHWAERHRFKINDQLVFRYKKENDSVLLVNKDSYDYCKMLPIKKLEDHGGKSWFRFNQSGSFFFISGEVGHCEMGQKVVVVVMADRKKQGSSIASPSSSPAMVPVGIGRPVRPPNGSASSSSTSSSFSSAMKGFLSIVVVGFSIVFAL